MDWGLAVYIQRRGPEGQVPRKAVIFGGNEIGGSFGLRDWKYYGPK